MQRLRVLRRGGNVRFHDFPDEEVIALDKAVIVQPALEAGVAFIDQGCLDYLGFPPRLFNA